MKLTDRIKRWWNPAQWKDEHTEVTEGGEGHPLSEEERAEGGRHIDSWVRNPETSTDYSDES
jgi:hypothetical protein